MKSTAARRDLHSVVTHVAETCLRTHGPNWTLSSMGGSPVARPESCPPGWPTRSPLVGEADALVFTSFRKRSLAEHLESLFYESTAMARWSDGPEGPALLDVVVRPRLGVRSAHAATRARELFRQVQASCAVAQKLGTAFAIDPVIEVWPSHRQQATPQQARPSRGGH